MLTIFACPKPFTDPHIAIIQRNAITSWTLLRPRPEIILFGDEPGVAEICEELGLRHVPEVARNEYGTPLLDNIFEKAQKLARYDLLCYVNADIILLSDFMRALSHATRTFGKFCMAGARREATVTEVLNFKDIDWEKKVRALAVDHYLPIGTDYFVFPRGLIVEIPPLALGRWGWDGWLLWKARISGMPLIDASKVVWAIHQRHDYCHANQENVQKEKASNNNLIRQSGLKRYWWLAESTHYLTPNGIKRAKLRKLIFWVQWTIKSSLLYRLLVYDLAPVRHRLGLRRCTIKCLIKGSSDGQGGHVDE